MNSYKHIGHKATKSIVTLVSRTFFLNVLNFAGAFFLTIYLSPADFGVFIVTSTVIDILAYFSDIGLAGALIQKKEKLEDEEVHATFTIQMGLVTIAIIIASFFAKVFANTYELDQTGVYLFYALLIAFFMSSLKTIPSVLSERKLKFENIAIPQVFETIIYNLIIIIMALKGFGVTSYIYAVLARAITGTIVIYYLVKWRPKLNFEFKKVKRLLSFGIPYQMNSLIAMFKDRVSLLIIGKIVGITGLGILGWAEKWSNLALRYFMDPVIKVAFPLFSRVQDEKKKAKEALEKSIYFISTLTFPALAGTYLVIPMIVATIPKYGKWAVGLPTFNLFLISAAIASVSTFLSNFLTAMGKVSQVTKLMVFWTVLTLSSYPLLAKMYGYQGVAIASIIVGISSLVTLYFVKKIVKFNLIKQIYPSLIASFLMILLVNNLSKYFGSGWVQIGISTVLGVVSYGLLILVIDGKNLINQSKVFLSKIKKSS
jgi:O-antigen/teichoic acid export membrane protein